MKNRTASEPEKKKSHKEREPYEAPAIIYEGLITTASVGSGDLPRSDSRGADPADVFGQG